MPADMLSNLNVGLAVAGFVLLLLGFIFIKTRAVLFFYVAAMGVGLGYLVTTGAVDVFGRELKRFVNDNITPVPGYTPAAATAPAGPTERPANPVSTVQDQPAPAP